MAHKRRQPTDPGTRARVLAAAGKVFARHGFAGARIDEIAKDAGVNKAMLYYHVGDKEGLYTAVLVETVERGLASLQTAAAEQRTPGEKLQAILDTLAAFGTSNPVFIPIMLREVASGGATLPDEMLARMAGVFRTVAEVLAEGVETGAFRATDPLLTHVSLVGSLLFTVATQPIRDRLARHARLTAVRHSPRDLARHVGGLMLRGLETQRRAPAKRGTLDRR